MRGRGAATTSSFWHPTSENSLGAVRVGVLLTDTLLISTVPFGAGASFINAFIKRSPLITQLWNVLSERRFFGLSDRLICEKEGSLGRHRQGQWVVLECSCRRCSLNQSLPLSLHPSSNPRGILRDSS